MQVTTPRHARDHALVRLKILAKKSTPKTVVQTASERSLKLLRIPILDCHSGIGLLQIECALRVSQQLLNYYVYYASLTGSKIGMTSF